MVSAEPGATAGPLDGIRVVELGGGIPAGFCTHLLAGFGADVVQVGDPALTADEDRYLSRGKRRVLADGDALAALLDVADVVVDGRSRAAGAVVVPSAHEIHDAHPQLVVTAVTPFGLDGPHAGHRAPNIVAFANGGIMSITGERERPPLQTGGDQALMLGGLHAFAATSTALFGALVQGAGDLLDISLQECAASMLEYCAAAWEYEGLLVERSGNTPRAEWGVYPAADGWAGVCCLGRQLPALFEQLDLEYEPRFQDPLQRAEHGDELMAHVLVFMIERTKDELVALGPAHKLPIGAVRTPAELVAHQPLIERGLLRRRSGGAAPRSSVPRTRLGGPGSGGRDRRRRRARRLAAGPGRSAVVKQRPLEGVRVLDLTMMWAGPYATKMLGEMGADVIKIESPRAWDNIRTLMPRADAVEDPWNSAFYFAEYNHEKRSVTLDLAQPAGKDAFLRLVANSDVVIENYRADVMDNLGLTADVLVAAKPDLVLVSMAGFGKSGGDRDNVGYGPIIEMMSGLMSLSGYDADTPQKTGISYGDPVAGLAAVGAIALALIKRRRTGQGSIVDLSQNEVSSKMAGVAFAELARTGAVVPATGNRHPRWAPQGCYPARGDDQWIVVSCTDDEEWAACARRHRPSRPRRPLARRPTGPSRRPRRRHRRVVGAARPAGGGRRAAGRRRARRPGPRHAHAEGRSPPLRPQLLDPRAEREDAPVPQARRGLADARGEPDDPPPRPLPRCGQPRRAHGGGRAVRRRGRPARGGRDHRRLARRDLLRLTLSRAAAPA